MATTDQVKGLIRSHANGDNNSFYAIAMQIAAKVETRSGARAANELRELAGKAKDRGQAPQVQELTGKLAGLMTVETSKVRVGDMELTDELRGQIDRVITEQRERGRLFVHGLRPMRKLLLVGPPGTGKTTTAAALACELGMQLFRVRLDGLITSFLGSTAANLRLVFDAIRSTRGVYVFDEFDAIGASRHEKDDVGEMRRIMNSLLVMLEQDESDSLIVCATNLASLLDRALFRRFDSVLEYDLPTAAMAARVMSARLGPFITPTVDLDQAAIYASDLSHAEITSACEQAKKNAILSGESTVSQDGLMSAIRERRHQA